MRAIVFAGLVFAAPARADHSSVHLTANGNVATTDNVFAQSDNRQGDLFFQVRPGVLFAYDAPRMIHELDGELEVLEYVLHSDSPSLTGHLGWKAFFTPGPRSDLTLQANGSTGKLNALSTRTSSDQTGIMVLPLGAIDTNQADATEYFSWIAGKDTRASQSAVARWTTTDDNAAMPTKTDTFEVAGSLGLEHTWRNDTLGLEGGGSYLRLERVAPPGAVPPAGLDKQLNPRATVVWRHDINRQWSASADAGAVYVNPIEGVGRRAAIFPIMGAIVAYTEAFGRATLNVRRAVTPNLFIAQNSVSDSAVFQLAMPLPIFKDSLRLPNVVGLGSFGVERSQLVDATSGTLASSFIVARVDASVAYTPTPGQAYGLRYEFVYQHPSAGMAAAIAPAFFRNTLYFTFSLRYPDRVAAQVPRRGQSVRSDRKDLAPIGAEPVVPDPTEQLPEGEGGEE